MENRLTSIFRKLSGCNTHKELAQALISFATDYGFRGSRYYDAVFSPATKNNFATLREVSNPALANYIGEKRYAGLEELQIYESKSSLIVNTADPKYAALLSQPDYAWIELLGLRDSTLLTLPIKTSGNTEALWSLDQSNDALLVDNCFAPDTIEELQLVAMYTGQRIAEIRQLRIRKETERLSDLLINHRDESPAVNKSKVLRQVGEALEAAIVSLYVHDPIRWDYKLEIEVYRLRSGGWIETGAVALQERLDFVISNTAFDHNSTLISMPDFARHQKEYFGSHPRLLLSPEKPIVLPDSTPPAATVLFQQIRISGGLHGFIRIVNRFDEPELSFTRYHEEMLGRIYILVAHYLGMQKSAFRLSALGNAFQNAVYGLQRELHRSVPMQESTQTEIATHQGFFACANALRENGFPATIVITCNGEGKVLQQLSNIPRLKSIPSSEKITSDLFKSLPLNGIHRTSDLPRPIERWLLGNAFEIVHAHCFPGQDKGQVIYTFIPLHSADTSTEGFQHEDVENRIRYWAERANLKRFLDVASLLTCLITDLSNNRRVLEFAESALSWSAHENRKKIHVCLNSAKFAMDISEDLTRALEHKLLKQVGAVDIEPVDIEYAEQPHKYSSDISEIKKAIAFWRSEFSRAITFMDESIRRTLLWAHSLGNVLELEPERLDVVRLIKDVIRSLQPSIAAKTRDGNKLHIELNSILKSNEPLEIVGDRLWLEELFLNLIDNAVKYSHFPSTQRADEYKITIELNREGRNIAASFTNWGLGIPEREYDSIFSGNYRSPNRDQVHRVQGIGMGLAICKLVVAAHKGSINVKSVPTLSDTYKLERMEGFKTTFKVTLSAQLVAGGTQTMQVSDK